MSAENSQWTITAFTVTLAVTAVQPEIPRGGPYGGGHQSFFVLRRSRRWRQRWSEFSASMMAAAYLVGLSSQAKWPESSTTSRLFGSSRWRNSALACGTTRSRVLLMTVTRVEMYGKSPASSGSSSGYRRTYRIDSTNRSPSYEVR